MIDPCELTAEDFHQALMDLLPHGWAWPRDPDAILSLFFAAIAEDAARLQARYCDLLVESNPTTTAELLPDWERALGLPDPCAPVGFGIEERRGAVIAALNSGGGASVAYFEMLARDRGYEVTIEERRPFRAGRSRCGSTAARLGPSRMRFAWIVKLQTPRVVRFRCGSAQSRCGRDRLGSFERATEIECLFERLKPAQTLVVFDYSDSERRGLALSGDQAGNLLILSGDQAGEILLN